MASSRDVKSFLNTLLDQSVKFESFFSDKLDELDH